MYRRGGGEVHCVAGHKDRRAAFHPRRPRYRRVYHRVPRATDKLVRDDTVTRDYPDSFIGGISLLIDSIFFPAVVTITTFSVAHPPH
ncbi:hypothetical protein E2C01_015661 [Portunus trituberculatus]|uniref:Uncharacterized protein n=1 Tax=Portunus trituberculatus TaxID=210409 RepID=A0A5B7DM69_PORTR|nr:hypothetical protein [Portunus trituberculatus]